MIFKKPIYADFLVTPRCNFGCSFCSASATNPNGKIKELSLEIIEKTFKEMDELELLRVSIEGGEPFLRDDIIEIIEMADQRDFEYYINSNGSLIDKQMAKRLGKTKVPQICLSIDGPNKEIHDFCRGFDGAFDKLLIAVKNLQNEGIKVQAIITLSSLNIAFFYQTLHFIKSIGIESASVMILATVGDARNNISLSYLEWSKLLLRLSIDKAEGVLPIQLRIVPAGESLHPWELYLPLREANRTDLLNQWIPKGTISSLTDSSFGCTAGKDSMAIDGYGNVYGCSLMVSIPELRAGNIKEETLSDIWFKSDVFNKFRASNLMDIQGPCKSCIQLDKCKGGCRACAFTGSKSINGSDLRCPKAKE